MSDTWKQWVGRVVPGDFALNRYLGGSEHSAVFMTERRDGDRVSAAAIKLIPAVPQISELQLYRWRLAAGLSHPHLIQIYEFGKCEMDGVPLLYVVMESAEENLAQVLSSRAITADETSVMIEPLLDALTYLHSAGFVHGHVKPTNILANGDQLKLSSDALYRAGDSVDASRAPDAYDPPERSPGFIPTARTMSAAGDCWSLGVTLVESLTRQLPSAQASGNGNPPLPPGLPEPFLDIARQCLLSNPASRCTVPEIKARLQGKPIPIRQGPVRQAPTGQGQTPKARNKTQGQAKASAAWSPPVRSNRRRYIVPIAIAAVLAVIFAAILFRHRSEAPQASADATQAPGVHVPSGQATTGAATSGQATPSEPAPQAASTAAPGQSAPQVKQDSIAAAAAPNTKAAKPEVKAPAPMQASAGGEVIQQVLPEVSKGARSTIRGTVKVAVKVRVDSSGVVKNAELESPGPSKYFARLALQAAQGWKFAPSKNSGGNGLSSWTLHFQFTRDDTTVMPVQDAVQ